MLTKFLVLRTAAAVPRYRQQSRRHIAFIRTAFNVVDCERLSCVGPERLCAEWMLKNDGKVRLHGLQPPPPQSLNNDGQPDSPFCLAQQPIVGPAAAVAPKPSPCAAKKPSPCVTSRPSGIDDCPPAAAAEKPSSAGPCAAVVTGPPKRSPVCHKRPSAATAAATAFFVNYNHLPSERQPISIVELDATGSSVTGTGFAHLRGCRAIERIVLADCRYVTNDACQWLCYVRETLHTLQISNCPGIDDCGLMQLERLHRLKRLELADLTGVKDMQQCRLALARALPDCDVRTQC